MIEDLIGGLKGEIEDWLPLMEEEIDSAIRYGCFSEKEIEWTLDVLLGLMGIGVGRKQFRRLNCYYTRVNPKFSREYGEFYYEALLEGLNGD